MNHRDVMWAQCSGVMFRGDEFRWEPGYYIEEIDGISGGGAVSFDSIPSRVGIHDVPNRRDDPRIFQIRGFVYAASMLSLGRMIDRLGSILSEDDARADLLWQEYGQGVRRASVRRFSTQEPTRNGDTRFADFRISFRASDQRVYGDTTITAWGSSVTVVHRGGYPAPVVIDVRGNSGGGYTVTGPRGRVYSVNRSISPGSVHRYLADEGVLLVDGVPQTVGVTRSDQLEIPYGQWGFTVNNGCELRVKFSPTWAP